MHPLFNKLKSIIKHFHQDSLYRNSIYLMVSTFIGAFFGFFFWIINTKIFTTEQIGLATTLISSITVISNFSLIGLNTGIIRYLPSSARKSEKISTVINIVVLTSIVTTIIYILGLSYLAPKLVFIKENILMEMFFMIVVLFLSSDTIFSNVFIAYRDTKYILIKSVVANIVKVIAPFIFIFLGTFGLFISASLSSAVSAIFSVIILIRIFSFNYQFGINKDIFLKIYKLSFGNYFASFIGGLPLMLLPIMITNNLGAKNAAYFYMDIMIINLLNIVQSSLNQSLFAEGSSDTKSLKKNVVKSIKLIIYLLIPLIIIVMFFGQYILSIFGKEYSNEGIALLRILSLSTIFTSINGTLSAILNVRGKVNMIMIMCIIGAIILLSLFYIFIPQGLTYLGVAWIIGEGIITLIYTVYVAVYFKYYDNHPFKAD